MSSKSIFDKDIDFIYIDDPKKYFNRISNNDSFRELPFKDFTILTFEITFSKNDKYDLMSEKNLLEKRLFYQPLS
jgi:hypothetical protein